MMGITKHCTARLSLMLSVALMCLIPAVASAQGADLEAEAALLEGDPLGAELEEKQKEDKVELADPDEKLHQQVETAREAIGKTFNALQTGEVRYVKVDEALGEIISKWLPVQDDYIVKHRELMVAYRDAASKAPAEQRKLAKQIVKMRKDFLKKIQKTRKKLDKVEKLHAKLAAKAAKEAPAEEGEGEEE